MPLAEFGARVDRLIGHGDGPGGRGAVRRGGARVPPQGRALKGWHPPERYRLPRARTARGRARDPVWAV